ncbi:MAG: nucleoside phosphorylase [Ilumatobacteraceae bacterium]
MSDDTTKIGDATNTGGDGGSNVRLPILGLDAAAVPERVLVVGDPARAALVAERLDDPVHVGTNREYATYTGRHRGTTVAVVSHGVGAAGAGVCFEELCRAGARIIVRAGTCGGMQPGVVDGDLVVATAAVREDGLTERLVPLSYPAVASAPVVSALRAAAADRDDRPAGGARVGTVHEGVVLTHAVFYPGPVLGSDLERWQRAGVVAVEMECAALFVVAGLAGRAAGAILAVDGNPLATADDDMSDYDPGRPVVHAAVDRMITVALDAVVAAESGS